MHLVVVDLVPFQDCRVFSFHTRSKTISYGRDIFLVSRQYLFVRVRQAISDDREMDHTALDE